MSTVSTEYECEKVLLVQADFDGELDAADSAALVQHRAECVHCQAAEEKLQRTRALMRDAVRYQASGQRAALRWRGVRRRPFGSVGAGWLAAAAAAVVVVAVLGWPRGVDLGPQLVSSHVRAMQLESHLIDVVSTDHHTVKPWFAGKVDFAPPVKQLDSHGYVLKGGRIDVVNGTTAAVMVYQAGKHVVDVYVWPTREGGSRLSEKPVEGFNLRHWQEDGFDVVAVSDMASAELDRFAERWKEPS